MKVETLEVDFPQCCLERIWSIEENLSDTVSLFKEKLEALFRAGYKPQQTDIVNFFKRRQAWSIRAIFRDAVSDHPSVISFDCPRLTALILNIVMRRRRSEPRRVIFEAVGLLLLLHRWDAKRADVDDIIVGVFRDGPYSRLLDICVDGLGSCGEERLRRCRLVLRSVWIEEEHGGPASWSDEDLD